jgi:hypothetical protein
MTDPSELGRNRGVILEQLPAPERKALKPDLPQLPRWLADPLALALA